MIKRPFDTVFNKIPSNTPTNEMLAVFLHRTAFTIYSIYCFWGILSIILAIPYIGTGDPYVTFFGFFMTPLAGAAAFGALYFPRHGRVEMFAAASLVPLIVAYLIFISDEAFQGDLGAIRNLLLNLVHVVIPTAKFIIIYRLLVRQAKIKRGSE